MKTTKRFALAALLGLAVAAILATPAPATAGAPKWFIYETFNAVGDEPHATGYWGITMLGGGLNVSCRGLTPGDTYYVFDHAGDGIGWFVADKYGRGGFATWSYPDNVYSGLLVYRSDVTGLVLVLESP